ncbi:hypothetical protein POM88_048075 [Heracleum sosnowskyi]|uniref:Uncharacterized protein n=1 Tax=Heracleum sosnowskyi TaxID=360622 RepID=A0AAD8GUM6_9APIA|nr:hypothetical protein POM88_048075 [Heracleum sosnowskyi]
MDSYLLKPVEEVQNKFKDTLIAKKIQTHDHKPTRKKLQRISSLPDYNLGMCKMLYHISNEYLILSGDSSPTSVKIALKYIEVIKKVDQRFHDLVPLNLRMKSFEDVSLVGIDLVHAKCYLAAFSELETSLRRAYDEGKAAKRTQKK